MTSQPTVHNENIDTDQMASQPTVHHENMDTDQMTDIQVTSSQTEIFSGTEITTDTNASETKDILNKN